MPDITRGDRARYLKLARRLRTEQLDRLLHAARDVLARLGHVMTAPAVGSAARTTAGKC